MPKYSGTITYQLNRRRYLMPVHSATTLTALQTFADQIKGLSAAGTVKVSLVASERPNTAQTPSADFCCSVDYFCNCLLKCGNSYREVPYPAPKLADFEIYDLKAGRKYKLKKTIGDQVAQWYSTLTGKTFVFVSGTLCGPGDGQRTG